MTSDKNGLDEEGRSIVEGLGGCWGPRGGMCHCPVHDDRTPSLSVRPGTSRLLFHCFAGCPATSVLQALQTSGLIATEPRGRAPFQSPDHDGTRAAIAARLWGEARSIAGTAGDRYLRARGLLATSHELRFHPRAPFGAHPLTEFRPALLAAVRDETGFVAVHRTFLVSPGGAGQSPSRRGLGPFRAGAVRLGGSAERLGLAEGIEDALSATLLFGIPCWATLGAERFGRIALPPEVRTLALFLDHDPGGLRAERLAREAYAGQRHIEVHIPDRPGDDWNDVLLRDRPELLSRGEGARGRVSDGRGTAAPAPKRKTSR